MNIDTKNLKIEYYKSSGPGGQRKNKKETAVKIIHIPTGISAVATETRSQFKNRQIALHRLEEKIKRLTKKNKKRIPTRIPIGIKDKILQKKKKRGQVKKLRRKDISYILKEFG